MNEYNCVTKVINQTQETRITKQKWKNSPFNYSGGASEIVKTFICRILVYIIIAGELANHLS